MSRALRPGHLVVLGYEGKRPPPTLLEFAARYGLGGVILFRRNCAGVPTLREVLTDLRTRLAEADPGWRPLVMVDQEGGRVERIGEGVPPLPPARELGRLPEDELAGRVRAQAEALAALGIDVNLAPVCDVLQEGESGAIGDRSFSEDPGRVGRLAAAHLTATLGGGVLPCAKHFPGHGGARVDSHRELPLLDKTLAGMTATDLLPFRAAVTAGVPLVMAGHLLCPAVSPRPATLSPEWIGGVLRQRLGFRGVVLTDDMEMGALDRLGPAPEVAVQAVNAGCDLLIYGRMLAPGLDVEAVAEALVAIPRERLREAERRVAGLGGRAP